MYKIVKKENLTRDTDRFYINAPLIADKAKAGQFVVIRINEEGERIPLTIAGYDHKNGLVMLVSQRVGKTTSLLSHLSEGDYILDVVGPLGKPSEIKNFGKVVCVGGGTGIAPVIPIATELKRAGNYVISIIGAKSSDYVILEEEMQEVSDELYVCTDDGSAGYKGFVSEFLSEYLEKLLEESTDENDKNDNKKTDILRVVAVGPALMMRAVSEVTKPFNIKTIVSLNSIMVDGTGMCGACRVEVGGKTKFVCVDGPEFDGHEVNFDLLISRQKIYLNQEKESMDIYKHQCGLEKDK